MTQEPIYSSCISLSSDTLVVRDQSNEKCECRRLFESEFYNHEISHVSVLHVVEVSSNKPITEGQPHTHLQSVTQLALNHIGSVAERQLAIIDVNRDLFLVSIRASGFGRVCKIGKLVSTRFNRLDSNSRINCSSCDGTEHPMGYRRQCLGSDVGCNALSLALSKLRSL